MTRFLPATALAAGVLVTAPLRADPPPLRIDYQAAAGCPGEDAFVGEIQSRTSVARLAAKGVEALEVRVRILRSGDVSKGELVLGEGRDRIVRNLRGEDCNEVVSAMALVTALAVDPHAFASATPPPSIPTLPSPAPVSAAPPLPPAAPASPPVATLPRPDILPEPLPVRIPALEGAPERLVQAGSQASLDAGGQRNHVQPKAPAGVWAVGARASVTFAATSRPLFGGGVSTEREFAGRWGASLGLVLEVAGTGAVDAGRGQVRFLRGAGRLEGCMFRWRPASWLSVVPCLAAEGGALHGEGIPGASLKSVQQATVPWGGAGFLPRIAVHLGKDELDVQGGPVFPLVRRTFVFQAPTSVIYALPAATGTISVGGSLHFP